MKYEREIYKMFEDSLRDSWMDDADWAEVMKLMKMRFDPEQMDKDIDTGIKNGYSLESQLELCRDILRKMKANERR